MKKVLLVLGMGLMMGGCAYTVIRTPTWRMNRISILWKTDGEISITTNGTVSARGASVDDSDAIKSAVGAAVSAAVGAIKP